MVKAGVRRAASTKGRAADAFGAAAAPPNGEGRRTEQRGVCLCKGRAGDAAAAAGGGGGGDGQRAPHVTARRRRGGCHAGGRLLERLRSSGGGGRKDATGGGAAARRRMVAWRRRGRTPGDGRRRRRPRASERLGVSGSAATPRAMPWAETVEGREASRKRGSNLQSH